MSCANQWIPNSLGQAPWLIEILWHLPGGEAMHRARRRAEDMMRNRIAAQGVTIRDLSSYLVRNRTSIA